VEKAVTTALLIITGVVCMIFVFNSVYPMINRSSQAMASMAQQVNERMNTRITIIHVANSADHRFVYLWIKNVGTRRIVNIKQCDLFFGHENNFQHVPYMDDAKGSYPQWLYTIENDTQWETSATLKVTIAYSGELGAGTYYAKFITPNGISDEYYFSM
jgi:archaellum component FlaF (FlaF/FlaG flagellin family)